MKGIENLGHVTLKYKGKRFEYFVEKNSLIFKTSDFDFKEIVPLVRKGYATYLGDKTIRCNIGSILFDIDTTEDVKKIKKALTNKVKQFLETTIFREIK